MMLKCKILIRPRWVALNCGSVLLGNGADFTPKMRICGADCRPKLHLLY